MGRGRASIGSCIGGRGLCQRLGCGEGLPGGRGFDGGLVPGALVADNCWLLFAGGFFARGLCAGGGLGAGGFFVGGGCGGRRGAGGGGGGKFPDTAVYEADVFAFVHIFGVAVDVIDLAVGMDGGVVGEDDVVGDGLVLPVDDLDEFPIFLHDIDTAVSLGGGGCHCREGQRGRYGEEEGKLFHGGAFVHLKQKFCRI